MIDFLSIVGIAMIAFCLGKIVTKFKMPAILGWLISGIIFGPYLVGLVSSATIEGNFYKIVLAIANVLVGVYFAGQMKSEKKDKNLLDPNAISGKSVLVITLFESVTTYIFVSCVFVIIFSIQDIPIFLAFIFGGIALATAPVPSISIVQQYKTKGPVTSTLVPVALIDDAVAFLFFFGTIAVVGLLFGSGIAVESSQAPVISKILPYIITIVVASTNAVLMKKLKSPTIVSILTVVFFLATIVGLLLIDGLWRKTFDTAYIFIGLIYMVILNKLGDKSKIQALLNKVLPVLEYSMLIVILDLGMPLDYRLITGAGVYTAIYILSRAFGKISGSALGGIVTKAQPTVKKYLGFTLLPHSGVSLIFTSMAIGVLEPFAPDLVPIIQGTIAAAAIINEIIAVLLANQAFKWAKEKP